MHPHQWMRDCAWVHVLPVLFMGGCICVRELVHRCHPGRFRGKQGGGRRHIGARPVRGGVWRILLSVGEVR